MPKTSFDKDTQKIPQKKITPGKNKPSPSTKRKSSNSART